MATYGLMWGVFRRDNLNGENDLPIAAFTTQATCRIWIELMRERHFFNTGSMDEAEEKWGDDKFVIDRTATFSRQDTFKGFPNPSKWLDA